MRLGISTWALPWAIGLPGHRPTHPLTPFDVLERAATLGVTTVQFADNLSLEKLTAVGRADVASRALELGITVEIGTRGIGDHLLDCLDLTRRFGTDFVRVVVDRRDDQPSPREVVTRLTPYENAFRRAGVVLAIENHDRFRCDELVGVVGTLGSWTGICLDTVNSLGMLEPPDHVLAQLAPLTVNVHLKDFDIRRAATGLGFEVVGAPAGEGRLDIPALLDRVADHGQTRSVIIEQWTPPGDSLADTIATEAQWLTRSVAHLTATTT